MNWLILYCIKYLLGPGPTAPPLMGNKLLEEQPAARGTPEPLFKRKREPKYELTLNSVAEGNPGVGRAESILQHLLLEGDDGLQHGLVLDLGGRDHDAAVHEVCDGIGHLLVSLGQVRLQAEHLGDRGPPVGGGDVELCIMVILCVR